MVGGIIRQKTRWGGGVKEDMKCSSIPCNTVHARIRKINTFTWRIKNSHTRAIWRHKYSLKAYWSTIESFICTFL